MSISVDQFSAQLTASGLLTPAEVEEVRAALQPPQAEAFARALVRLQKLTPFQAQQCLAGKGKSLVLGNYVLLEKLGQGGMGMVLKAQHRRMKRIVALKVLSPAVARSPELVARFQREMEAAARLSHPNIVAAYDANEAGGLFFLVMEYVEGQDLSTRVKTQGPLPLGQALEYIVQAARGLEYAHQQGVIHRDIKPANLLLTREGTVKILDMGLARLEGETGSRAELTSTGAVMGTVDYMAPEQALSTKKADARSDVYSLGITLWYLLTGRPPYEGDSLMSRLLAHRESPIPSLCQVASGHPPDAQWRGVDAVFRRMVAKRPEDRFQSMTEVIAALERCRHGAVPQPGAAVGPSEDRRLNDVLSHSEKESGSQTVPLAPTSATLPLSPGMVSEATLTSAEPEFPTDPQTEVQPLLLPRTLRRTSMRPGGPAWRRPGVIAGGAAGLLLVAGLTWWLLAGRKATSSREEVSTLTTAAAPGAPRSPPADLRTVLKRIADRGGIIDVEENGRTYTVDRITGPPVSASFVVRRVKLPLRSLEDLELLKGLRLIASPFQLEVTSAGTDAETAAALREIVSASTLSISLGGADSRLTPRFGEQLGPHPVEYLIVSDGRLEPGSLAALATLPQLKRLLLQRCNVSPEVLSETRELKQLQHLNLERSNVGDAHLTRLNLPASCRLSLYDTQVTAAGVVDYLRRHPQAPLPDGVSASLLSEAQRLREPVTFALQFDGIDDSVEVPGLNLPEGPFTLEALVTPEASGRPTPVLYLVGAGGATLAAQPEFCAFSYAGKSAARRMPLPEGPVHVAGVFDGETLTCFVNGREAARGPAGELRTQQSGAGWIGQEPGWERPGEHCHFKGRIQALRVSRGVRYPGDFQPQRSWTSDPDTLALYRFEEGAGDLLRDSSGRDLHGKIVGAQWVRIDGGAAGQSGPGTRPSP